MAQRLTEEAQEQAGRWEGELKDIEVPGEISIRLIDILRAGGRGDSFLTVVPPPSYRGRHEAWLGGLCRGFFRQGGSPVPGGTDLS